MNARGVIGACLVTLCAATVFGAANSDTRLLEAVKSGSRPLVQTLLRAHVAVDTPEADGTTALHWAVRASDVEIVRLLLKAGADAKAANRYGVTPLSLAAVNGDGATIELLLKAGADVNAALPQGETVLMTASRTGNADAVRILLDHGADVNAQEHRMGETALMWAAAENHPDAVRLLADYGAELDARSSVLKFPKYYFNASAMVSTPLPRGGMTALQIAARQGALDGVRALVAAGSDVNLTDLDGTTALVLAIINRHNDVAELLANHGADPNIADAAGMAALYAAVDLRALGPLINRPTPQATSSVDNVELVKVLLEHGANPNARLRLPTLQRFHNGGDKQLGDGATPLMRAAKAKDLPVMLLLLDNGADVNLVTRDYMTALLFAASGGRTRSSEKDVIAALKVCLDHGADVNAFDINGATALSEAITQGDEIVKFLAAHGADLQMRDKQGRTALDIANGVSKGFNDARAGQRAPARKSTVTLLQQLMGSAAANSDASAAPGR